MYHLAAKHNKIGLLHFQNYFILDSGIQLRKSKMHVAHFAASANVMYFWC